MYFANHTSHLDALVLWAALRPDARALTRPVAARDYWLAGPLRRHLATRVFDAVLVERRHGCSTTSATDGPPARHPLAPLLDALENRQNSLIFFPEGTRGSNSEPAPFKSGLHCLARARPDVEFIPVLIDNMNRILPKGELLPVPLLGGLSFGAPVRLHPGEEKADFLARARRAVSGLRRP